MLHYHSLKVRKTKTKFHTFHLVYYSIPASGAYFLPYRYKKRLKLLKNIAKKCSFNNFRYFEKHAISAICDLPRFRWLMAAPYSVSSTLV